MALDLNDEKAIDYSSNIPFLPYEALGDYVFDILGFEEFEGHNGDGDLVTLKVVESSCASVRAGDKVVFLFRTDVKGDGKAFAAARLRSFVRAACGVPDSEARGFDANKGRKDCLAEEYSKGGNLVRLTRGEEKAKPFDKDGKPSKHAGKTFTVDTWKPAA